MSDNVTENSSLTQANSAQTASKLFDNEAHSLQVDEQAIYNRRVLRFTLGVGFAVAISAVFAWPLAFIVPVFVAKFLIDRQAPTLQTVYELILSMSSTVLIAWLVSFGPVHFPLVLLPTIAGLMLWAYYLFSDPKWNFFATVLLISVLLLPYLGLQQPAQALIVGIGLSFSGLVAVAIFTLLHILFPDLSLERDSYSMPVADVTERVTDGLKALILSFPVICFFYLFEISSALLTMIFIAILSLQAAGAKSVKLSLFLLITNGIGGLLAVIFYNLLVFYPSLVFYILLSSFAAIIFGSKIYLDKTKAPIFAGIFSALIVVVGSSVSSVDKEALENFYLRIAQLLMVGAYLVFASYYLESRSWSWFKGSKTD